MRIRLAAALTLTALLSACGGQTSSIEFSEIDPPNPRLGEIATVRFKVLDFRGQALAGAQVNFRLQGDAATAGVVLSPTTATSIKSTGVAETTLLVSSRISSVVVIASVDGKEAISPPLSFAGGSANHRQMTFQCGSIAGPASGGLHAIGAYDQSRYLIAGVKSECIAHIGDRNGDGVPNALVTFITEAGTIGPSEISQADVLGNAKVLYKTSFPLPKEVTPETFVWNPTLDDTHTGEYLVPLWMEPYRWSKNPIQTLQTNGAFTLEEPRRIDPLRARKPDGSQYQNNPRDNLVSMVAITSGEEGYTDTNNNGKYDADEPYDDLTEPFVDANDNGTWDPDERYVDTNGDKVWSGKNGKWDGATLIWRQERILWTGIPDLSLDFRAPEPSGRSAQTPSGAPIVVGCKETIEVNVIASDPWWNSLASNKENDGCTGGDSDVVKIVGGSTGIVFTYPTLRVQTFGVADALPREPMAIVGATGGAAAQGCFTPGPIGTPPSQPPYHFPYNFGVLVKCEYSAARLEGHVVTLPIFVTGTIYANINP